MMMKLSTLLIVVGLAACAGTGGPGGRAGTSGRGAGRPPSFVLIVTDDQSRDAYGAGGHPILKTPNIDRIAREGVTLSNAFVTTAICAISRASIITGTYARHHGIVGFDTALPPQQLARSLPAVLKANGYKTGCIGKWGIGGEFPLQQFDFWNCRGGWNSYFHDVAGRHMHDSEFQAWEAEKFMRTVADDRPFFLIINFKAPHEPWTEFDPVDASLFEDVTIPRPPNSTAQDFSVLPGFLHKSLNAKTGQARLKTEKAYQSSTKNYLRQIVSVDRAVGHILGVLDELGLSNDTMVLYTSDHGYFHGEHGLSGKWLMYEESIRVPMLIRYPRLGEDAHGTSRGQIALNIDLAPTLLDFAGAPVPPEMDGVSLRRMLEDKAAAGRDDFFYEHHFTDVTDIPRSEGVRGKRWKYVRYIDEHPAYEQLFDLDADPHEARNLVDVAEFRPVLESHRARHQQYVKELAAPRTKPAPAHAPVGPFLR